MLEFVDRGTPAAGAKALVLLARKVEDGADVLGAQGPYFFRLHGATGPIWTPN